MFLALTVVSCSIPRPVFSVFTLLSPIFVWPEYKKGPVQEVSKKDQMPKAPLSMQNSNNLPLSSTWMSKLFNLCNDTQQMKLIFTT